MWVPIPWILAWFVQAHTGFAGQCEEGGLLQLQHGGRLALGVTPTSNHTKHTKKDTDSDCKLKDVGIEVDLDGVIDVNEIFDKDRLEWLRRKDGGSFIMDIIEKYVTDPALERDFGVVRGTDIFAEEKCRRLPLKPDRCFFNLIYNASVTIVLDKLPFAAELLKLQAALRETTQEPALDSFFKLEKSLCLAANQEMFGVYSYVDGFPLSDKWKRCVCPPLGKGLRGTPFKPNCAIQFQLFGFAFGIPGRQNLQLPPALGNFSIYDGLVLQTLPRKADAWAAFELIFVIPPLFTGFCEVRWDSRVQVKGTLWASYASEDKVFQVIADDVNIRVPLLLGKSTLGKGIASLRLASKNQDCRPVGFYGRFEASTANFKWSAPVEQILGENIKFTGLLSFGLIAKTAEKGAPRDQGFEIRAFFYQVQVRDLKFFTIEVGLVNLEYRFVTVAELNRLRRIENGEVSCCTNKSTGNESTDDESQVFCPPQKIEASELTRILLEKNTPALAIYYKAENINISIFVGRKPNITVIPIIFVKEFSVLFLAEPVEGKMTMEAKLNCSIAVLPYASGRMKFEIDLNDFKFEAELEVNGKVVINPKIDLPFGTAPATLQREASEDDGTLTVNVQGLASVASLNLLDADWDFKLDIPFEQVKKFISGVKRNLGDFWAATKREGQRIIEGMVQFAEDTFDSMLAIAKTLGTNIAKLFENIKDSILKAVPGEVYTVVEKGITGVVELFNSGSPSEFIEGVWDLAGDGLDGLTKIGNEMKGLGDALKGAGDLADKIAQWFNQAKRFSLEQIRDFASNLVDAAKYKDPKTEKTGEKDEIFGCDIYVNTRKERFPQFRTVKWNPCEKEGGVCTEFPDPDCVKVAAEKLAEIKAEADGAKACDDAKSSAESAAFDTNGPLPDLDVQIDPNELFEIDFKPGTTAVAKDLLPLSTTKVQGGGDVAVGPADTTKVNLNVENPQQFEASLQELMKKSAEELGKKASNGGSLKEKLADVVKTCTPLCNPEVKLTPKGNFPKDVEVDCTDPKADPNFVPGGGDFTALFPDFFATVDLAIDSKCPNTSPKLECTLVSNNEGSNPSIRTYNCFVTDCCGETSNALQQKLLIGKNIPPLLIAPGDVNVPVCTDSIDPDATGQPTVVPGCPGLAVTTSFSDVETVACETTVVRTWSAVDEEGNGASAEQTIVVEHNPPPSFTSPPGSLDLVLQDCASNIHPDAIGIGKPSYAAGCPGADPEVTWSDVETFDDGACKTTVVRTWELVDRNCREKGVQDTFVQTIVLEQFEPPLFETFPNDVTIDVFAPYGTDSTGFPTSYSVCNNPVTINYVDVMKEGSCFAERIIERTFTSQDVCGQSTDQTQLITIGTPPERLPLGNKSSYYLYAPGVFFARSRRILGYLNKQRVPRTCSIDAALCGGPSEEDSCNSSEVEFADFEEFLVQIGEEASLDKGSLRKECSCPVGDASCEVLEGPGVVYGPRIIKSSGMCKSKAKQSAGINGGETLQEAPGIVLKGTNQVYNFFTLDAEELVNKTVAIQCPATSIVVTNLQGSISGQDLQASNFSPPARVAPDVQGIILRNQISPSHVLFNAPGNVSFTVRRFPTDRAAYTFRGSLLARRGTVNIFTGIRNPLDWIGQIYSTNLRARNVNFQCSHFAGFASCAEWPPSFVQLNSSKPFEQRST